MDQFFVVGGRRAEVAFCVGGSNSSNPLNSLTASDASLGVEHPSRQIIVLVRGTNSNLVSDQNYTTAVTVGGVAATRKIALPAGNTNSHMTAWITPRADAGGPTGTTGNIVATRSTGNGYSFVAFAVFAAYHLRSSDPIDDAFSVNTMSLDIDLTGGGILTALAIGVSSAGHYTWTGAAEVYDATGGVGASSQVSAALLSMTAAESEHSVAVDKAANMLLASWR